MHVMTRTHLKAAVVQFSPTTVADDPTRANLERMADYVAQAAAQDAQLVVFPELGTCGYGIDGALHGVGLGDRGEDPVL
jgi:predicted amidohydrolase